MEAQKINLDALKRSNWSETELENARLAVDFMQRTMNDHDFSYVQANYSNEVYKQHNPAIFRMV